MSDHFIQSLMYGAEVPFDKAVTILRENGVENIWDGLDVTSRVYLGCYGVDHRFFLSYEPLRRQPLSDGPREVHEPWIVFEDLGSTYDARESLIGAAVKIGLDPQTLTFSWCLGTSFG